MTEQAMKEWPLIFSGDSIRAILAGAKTQSRRPVSPANSTVNGWPAERKFWPCHLFDHAKPHAKSTLMMVLVGYVAAPFDANLEVPFVHPGDPEYWTIEDRPWNRIRPKWEVGDRLWVREAHWRNGYWSRWCGADPIEPEWVTNQLLVGQERSMRDSFVRFDDPGDPAHWRKFPAMFLPRWAARLILEITDVRVERLQSISEADAIAEGVRDSANVSAREHFARLWDQLNGRRAGCSWVESPWCWCLSFKKIEI